MKGSQLGTDWQKHPRVTSHPRHMMQCVGEFSRVEPVALCVCETVGVSQFRYFRYYMDVYYVLTCIVRELRQGSRAWTIWISFLPQFGDVYLLGLSID